MMKRGMTKEFNKIHTNLLKVKILRFKVRDRSHQKKKKKFQIRRVVSGTYIMVLKKSRQ